MLFECYNKFVTLTIILSYFVTYLFADENIQRLPFCNPHVKDGVPVSNDLVIVSTLDGLLTAFSTKDGAKAWDLQTQPLLSSNLQHVELTSGGKWVRLVPSLRGTLYSLSGDTIEPLPFDAEQLLSSSFKYSDDLVIAGARETLWLGVDANTGGVIYECGSGGCNSEQQTAGAGHDVLVLRRHSNTVRALDPRTGNEKWNFSVAEHNLALSRRECTGPSSGPPSPLHVGVALPEGVIAIRRPGETDIIWRQKLEAPVVSMWRLHGGSLQHIDVLWEATRSLAGGGVQSDSAPPSLYIGVHDKQLYIQEGVLYAQKLETSVSARPLPWKLLQSRPSPVEGDTALQVQAQEPDPNTLSLITLYGNTGQTGSHGFFLYLQETCDQGVQVDEDFTIPEYPPNASDEDHHHIHIHVSPLWYWWKELLVFAVSSALLMNLMIWPMIVPKASAVNPVPTQEYIVIDRPFQRPPSNSGEFTSRYENDFLPLRCLGRGGFGVVFEARNNIDHREYAIKRITLPKREDKRERVLREVRALAKLEHDNIVRYFNAWIEVPPPRWQQERDAQWMRELEGSSLGMSNFTATSPPPPSYRKEDSVKLNLHKTDEDIFNPDFDKLSKRNRSQSCSDSFTVVFDEDASKHSNFTFTSETPKKQHSSDTSRKPSGLGSTVFRSQSSPGTRSPGSRSPGNGSPGLSNAAAESPDGDSSIDKRLQRVKEHEEFSKTESISGKKKKKGHTRHWSLDMCVRVNVEDTKMYLYIQMQLCRRDSLHDWLRMKRTADDRGGEVKSLFSQIVSAVEYVHLAGLIHRDLKPSNIFFAPDGRVKVGDFGLVTTMADNSKDGDQPPIVDAYGSTHTHQVGTHLYMSPEQLLGRPYSYKVDIYSLGVILFELLQPFGTDSERVHCLQNLRSNRFPARFHDKYPQETEVLKLMLSEDPSQRPTAMGVRARAPLFETTDTNHHFNLPSLSVTC